MPTLTTPFQHCTKVPASAGGEIKGMIGEATTKLIK